MCENRLTDDDGKVSLDIHYGIDGERVMCEWTDSTGNVYKKRLYFGEYEITETNGTKEDVCYINSPDGLTAVMMHHGSTYKIYYLCTDHLGSITLLMNDAGNTVERHAYDAWGRKRNVNDWSDYDVENGKLDRGYTGHESLREFGLINMNGRMYDPILGRMLSPDNYVQDPFDLQCYNRYSYCLNNPLSYVDPSGEIAWFVPVIFGAVIGAYSGAVIANDGNYNPAKWDYNSGKTWGYMLGGAVAGAASGYLGGAVAASGIPFANTLGIATASFTNSALTHLYTGGQTPVSISFGVCSYDFTNNEFGYLGKEGNSVIENIGYSLGALANLGDILAGFHPGNVESRTENDPNYSTKGDPIGHFQVNRDGKILIDWGPAENKTSVMGLVKATNQYEEGVLLPNLKGTKFWDPIQIKGVNVSRLESFANYLNKGGRYNLLYNNCVNMGSRALNISGVLNIGIHPYILHTQMYLRSIGFRPDLWGYYLNNKLQP